MNEQPAWCPQNVTIEQAKGKQTRIMIGDGHSGIEITINKRRRSLYVSGWYDSMVGIEGAELPLDALVALFGEKTR